MAIDNETKLLPCPFCGNPSVLFRDTEYDRTLWIIECNQCHMEVAAKHKDLIHGRKSTHDDLVDGWNRRAEEAPPQGWISVEDSMPPEHETIFAKLYGTDKWRNAMFRKMSDDVRVVKIFNDGTKRVHHDHTVDGVWESERKGTVVYGYVTHWMQNPELPKVIE